jgi:multiple sugar transport system permease protein
VNTRQNYQQAFTSREFVRSVRVQVELSFVTVVLQLLVGLGIGLLLDKSSKLLETIRTGFLMPASRRNQAYRKVFGPGLAV